MMTLRFVAVMILSLHAERDGRQRRHGLRKQVNIRLRVLSSVLAA
jgi:hypothetical protein